jgi:potassium efflux system protein
MVIKAITSSLIITFFLIISSISAQANNEITIELIDLRLQQLSKSGSNQEDEIVNAYQTARNWLDTAASHERDATNYLDALKNAAERKEEILAWVDSASTTESQVEYDLENTSINELQAKLPLLRTQLTNATNTRNANERRLLARDANAQQIIQRQSEIVNRLSLIPSDPFTISTKAPPSLAEALQWQEATERIALNAEQKAQESEQISQPARYDLLSAEQAQLALQIGQLTSEIHAIESRLIEALLEDADSDIVNVAENSPIYKLVQKIDTGRESFRQYRINLVEDLSNITDKDQQIQERIRLIEERKASLSRVIEYASDSDVLGNVLLVHWREIDSYQIKDPTRFISDAIGNTIIKRIDYEETVAKLSNKNKYITNLLEEAGLETASITDADQSKVISLLQSVRYELTNSIKLQSDYIELQRKHLRNHSQFSALIKEYRTLVGSWILWVPSNPPIYKANYKNIPEEIQHIYTSFTSLKINAFAIANFIGLLATLILFLLRKRFKEFMAKLNRKIGATKSDSIIWTLASLGLTVIRALPLPLFIWFLSGIFTSDQASMHDALSSKLQALGMLVFLLLMIRIICEKNGVGSTHFNWYRKTCDATATEVNWWLYWWTPLVAAASVLFVLHNELYNTVLDQVVILGLILFVGAHFVSSLMATEENWTGIFAVFKKHRIKCLMLLIVVVVFFGVSMGYVYTVRTLVQSIISTFWLILFLVLIYNLFKRWLLISQRNIRLAEYKAKLKQAKDGEQHHEEERAALVDISRETSQLLKVMIAVIGVLMLWYLWKPLLPAFDALQRVTLWTTMTTMNGESVLSPVTLNSVVIALLIGSATIYTAGKLPSLIELILRQRAGISASAGYTISSLLNYVIFGAGFIIVLSALGLNWSKLQWLVAALGVGIGFGLQEIVANFISGIIILFERPIRVGDIVTTGNNEGTVSRIRIRATTIIDWDGKELLVPNKEFITGRVLNWTLSTSSTRVVINVGVAYGSDIAKALEILKEVIHDHPRIIADPAPSIIFKDFGDSTLNLAARGYIDSMENRIGVISELNETVYKRFAEAGIVIAFPQRDIHFNSENPIRVSIQKTDT